MRTRFVSVIAVAFLLIAGLSAPSPVFAQQEDLRTPIQTEIPIPVPSEALTPGSEDRFRTAYLLEGKVEDLAQYIGIIYNFLISIVGLVAAVMMIVGGFQYLTSAGDSGRIGAAKTRMANAFIGLVLALGAWTILNSINPALLKLALPGFRSVSSELIFLPWCDELVGTQVNPVRGSTSSCGSVGEYMKGKTRLACLYRGACPNDKGSELPDVLKTSAGLRRTCIQTLTTSAYVNEPLTSEQVFFLVEDDAKYDKWRKENPDFDIPGGCGDKPGNDTGNFTAEECAIYNNWYIDNIRTLPSPYAPMEARPADQLDGEVSYYARCMSCLEYGAGEKRGENLKYQTPHEGRCRYWQLEANGGVEFSPGAWDKRKADGQPLLSYCRWMPDEGGCAQADFTCKEPTASSSCSNYDGIKPFYMFHITRGGYVWWMYGGGKNGTLNARPDALQGVCFANPCGYNGGKGCTGEGGFINGVRTAAAVIRDGISGIQACDDN